MSVTTKCHHFITGMLIQTLTLYQYIWNARRVNMLPFQLARSRCYLQYNFDLMQTTEDVFRNTLKI